MFLTLGAVGQSVQLKNAIFKCDHNFLDELNAKLTNCLISGEFKKADLNFASGNGIIDCEIATKCFRCGTDVNVNLKIKFNERFHAENTEEYYPLNGSRIELDQMIIDNILLSFPNMVLCNKNCLGRCCKCGKNLNEGKCCCCEELILDNPANPFNVLKKLKFNRRK